MFLPLKIAFNLIYFLALIFHGKEFLSQTKTSRVPWNLVLCGFFLHTLFLLGLVVELGAIPYLIDHHAFTFFSWVFVFCYLIIRYFSREPVIGIFALPIALAAEGFSWLSSDKSNLDPLLLGSTLIDIHLVSLLISYASLSLAFIISSMYILLFHEIKGKRLGFFYSRMPSLSSMDRLNATSVYFGFALLSIALISGLVWYFWQGNQTPEGPTKIVASFLIWGYYLALIRLRKIRGWEGIPMVYGSIAGFFVFSTSYIVFRYFI
jgi:ABC-type uncharacterized transport system permease subunit